jgi:hypothetical protein
MGILKSGTKFLQWKCKCKGQARQQTTIYNRLALEKLLNDLLQKQCFLIHYAQFINRCFKDIPSQRYAT